MAESPSSALEGGVDWLPALGGARLLRTPTAPGDAPALILRAATGEEHRIVPGPEGRFGRHTDYLVPAGVTWATAFLQWEDGTRAAVPTPAIPSGELIEFRARRPATPATWPSIGSLAPAGERAAVAGALPSPAERPPSQDAWTAPPNTAGEAERAARRPGGDSVLAALAGVRAQLRVVRAVREADTSALTTLAGELDAERTAHAVTRGTAATLADALAGARVELAQAREAVDGERQTGADARAHLASARRDAALARAEVATLRADLEAERAARARAEAALSEARSPFLQRVAELDRDVAGLRDQVRLERRAREQAEASAAAVRRPLQETGRMVADLDAAAAALRAATPPEPSPPAADAPPAASAPPVAPAADELAAADSPPAAPPSAVALAADASAAADSPPAASPSAVALAADASAAADSPPAASASAVTAPRARTSGVAAPVPFGRDRRLRQALVELAHEDPMAAGTLLAGLLPAQAAVIGDAISYDLTVRGVGTFAVSLVDGSARVRRIPRGRPRREAAFHLAAEPLALAELLAGERRKVRRFGHAAKFSGRRKPLRALTALPVTRLSMADVVRAGARLEPWLVYRALPHAIPPEWTRGHVFTVAQEIVELAPRAWYITARDGVRLTVVEHVSGAAADATVTMNRATFDRLLRGESAAGGELPVIRGDRDAVMTLKRWADLARGA